MADKDQQRALDLHNEKRQAKGVQPLRWDAGLANDATAYAQHLASIGNIAHSPPNERPNQGESLIRTFDTNPPPCEYATKAWLDEENNYHGEPIGEGDFTSYGHYTQCVWSKTTSFGIGWAKDADGYAYVVGRYSPPGNVGGQKPY